MRTFSYSIFILLFLVGCKQQLRADAGAVLECSKSSLNGAWKSYPRGDDENLSSPQNNNNAKSSLYAVFNVDCTFIFDQCAAGRISNNVTDINNGKADLTVESISETINSSVKGQCALSKGKHSCSYSLSGVDVFPRTLNLSCDGASPITFDALHEQ